MTYDQWIETYKPAQNDIVQHASFDGTMYETYGEEIERIREARDKNLVWTICDEDGEMYIVNGFWNINRLGYFITQVPYEGDRGDIYVNF